MLRLDRSRRPARLTADRTANAFHASRFADIVRAERLALSHLGIERIALAVGGSLGGMRALQWALDAPERIGYAVAVGAHDHHSAMGIALNALQREALELDPREDCDSRARSP